MTRHKYRLPAMMRLNLVDQLVRLIGIEQRDGNADAIGQRFYCLLRALVLRRINRSDAGVAEDARDLLRALDSFGSQIGILIIRLQFLFRVSHENDRRQRSRERREIGEKHNGAENGEQHREHYYGFQPRSGLVCFFHL